MANERNSFKAGVFIIVTIILILGIIIGIKGVGRFLEPMQHLTISFKLTDDIGGLAAGDDVRVGGAKVGVVRGVDFQTNDGGEHLIVVSYTMPKRFTIHKDAIVSIESTVTGTSVLNFSSFGSGDVLADGEILPGRPSALTELFNAAPEITATIHDVRSITIPKVNTAIDTATATIKHVDSKVDPVMGTAQGALQNIRDLFGDIKVDFRTTVANVREITTNIKDRLPGMMDKVDGLLGRVTTAVGSTNDALQDVKKIAANTRDLSATARDVVINNRGRIDTIIESLKSTGENLKNASSEIRHSPWRLLYKPAPGEMANLNLYDSARQFAEGAGELNDAALALRDAVKDPDVNQEQLQKLMDKLDKEFTNFNDVEQQLWQQVKQ